VSRRRKDGARATRPAREKAVDPSWLDHLLFWRRKNTAQTAKQRLMAVLEAERAMRGGARLPDYLPALQRELVRVVSKYAKVPSKEVRVRVERRRHGDGVELKVELPGAASA
jgi:cell division topological specificity factor